MNIEKTEIDGCYILTPDVFRDPRGYFFESYNYDKVKNYIDTTFIQDNQSYSEGPVIRGLHMQMPPYAQAKLVRCVSGWIYDVCVDVRPNSPTFGKHVGVILTEDNFKQLYIPEGCLHGFSVISYRATVAYKCNNVYNKASEVGVRYDDPAFNINWQFDTKYALLSSKDLENISFKELCEKLNVNAEGQPLC